MKVGRLLGVLVSFFLLLAFVRKVNGASFIGTSEVLARLSTFEFDLEPFSKLVEVWKESYKKSLVDSSSPGNAWEYILSAFEAIYKKLLFIGDMISYLWDNGVSLFAVPIRLVIQLWDFVLWLLGFTV